MAPLTGSPKLSRISSILLLCASIPLAHASDLFTRQAATCGGKQNLQQCGSSFPSSFCCPKDTTCMSFDSAGIQSVLCCPSGGDCAFIQAITCDTTQFNATTFPDNQYHLSETKDVELPKCGDKCCPLGYKCNGSACAKDDSPSPTSSALPTSSASNPASASQTTNACPAPVKQDQGFDGKSFAAGFFPGFVIGALGVVGLIWGIKKRREQKERDRESRDFGNMACHISDPIYDPAHAARTDFIRRGSHSAQNSPNSTTGMVQRNIGTQAAGGGLTPKIKSMWERTTPKLGFGTFPGLPSNPSSSNAPRPPPPAVRAGNNNTDPYMTPEHTPRVHRTNTNSTIQATPTSTSYSRRISKAKYKPQPQTQQHHGQRPDASRSGSTETIDVLMPAPSFLMPPKAPGMRENRFTADSGNTTFTKLMEKAGFDEQGRTEVRDWRGSPGKRG